MVSRFRAGGTAVGNGMGSRDTAAAAVVDDLRGALVMNNSIDASALSEGEFVVHKKACTLCAFFSLALPRRWSPSA